MFISIKLALTLTALISSFTSIVAYTLLLSTIVDRREQKARRLAEIKKRQKEDLPKLRQVK